MALFRKKKDEEDVQTAEHEAVGGDTAETGAVAASAVEPEPSAGDGNGGGSFIPSGGARVESDSAAKPETEASGETADNVQETGERAEERRDDAEGAPPASARVGDSETPHQAQRRGEGLPEPEDIGGRASAIRQSPPTTHTAPDPAEAPRESPLGAQRAAEQGSDRPEVAVAGAFLAGLVFARLLAWMGGDDDE